MTEYQASLDPRARDCRHPTQRPTIGPTCLTRPLGGLHMHQRPFLIGRPSVLPFYTFAKTNIPLYDNAQSLHAHPTTSCSCVGAIMSPHLAVSYGFNPSEECLPNLTVQQCCFNFPSISGLCDRSYTASASITVMAGLAGRSGLAHCPPRSCFPILAGNLYLHHPTHLSLQSGLDEPDLYDEFHDIVSRYAVVDMTRTDAIQDANSSRFWLPDLMARPVPLHEHVHQTTTRAAKEGTPYRSFSGHTRRGLEARAGELSR